MKNDGFDDKRGGGCDDRRESRRSKNGEMVALSGFASVALAPRQIFSASPKDHSQTWLKSLSFYGA